MQDNVTVTAPKLKEADAAEKQKKGLFEKLGGFVKKNKRDVIIMGIAALLAIASWVVMRFVFGHSESISNIGEEVFPSTVFTVSLFGNEYPISQSVVSGWITVGFILVLAVLFRLFIVPKMSFIPGKIQHLAEMVVGMFNNIAKNAGHYAKGVGPIVFGLASFICVGTLMELTGLRPPNADVNTCIATAMCTFILIHYYGFKEKKRKRFGHYINPINIITDLATPLSMTFRLFGSILSGTIVMAMLNIVLAPVIPAFLSILFVLFHAFIQAYIFATLSATFIGEAVE